MLEHHHYVIKSLLVITGKGQIDVHVITDL